MKKSILIITVLFSLILSSCEKDTPDELNPVGISLDGYTIQLLDFINSNEGWIFVSVNGQQNSHKLIHSTDGFTNYTVVNENIPRFRKMKFIDNNIGYGISWDGSDKTYYTNDGGVTWQNFIIPADYQEGGYSLDITYNDTYFVMPYKKENSSFVMIAGIRFFNRTDFSFNHKVLFNTEPVELYGGASGTESYYSSAYVTNSGKVCITGVYKPDDSFGYEEKSFGAYSTDGNTLTTVEIADKYQKPERTLFTSNNIGYYTMKDDANLYKTTNSGETWSSVYTFNTKSKYKSISFSDDENGAILVGKTELYITKDGGDTFKSASLNDEIVEINQVDCVDNSIYISAISMTADYIPVQKLIKISN